MNVYIACSSKNFKDFFAYYKEIRNEVIRQGHTIPADWLGRLIKKTESGKNNDTASIPNLKEEGIKAIDESDCLVAEVSISSSSVGYQIGHALSKRISTLCLYSKNFGEKKAPQILDVSETSILKVEEYDNKELHNILKSFFEDISSTKLIKFNFIVTPEIERYISWGAAKNKVSKSEFLRQKVIDELIKKDPKFPK